MGGTFDPPHMGHLIMAESVRETLSLDEIWFIPVGKIPHKDSSHTAPAKDRLAMVRLAVADNAHFMVNSIEADVPEYSYTCDTLEKLKQHFPEYCFTFIVGADSLDYMERWKDPERIFRACTVAAVHRLGYSAEMTLRKKAELESRYHAVISIVPVPCIQISSTEIRNRIRQGKSIHYLVPEAVLRYVKEHKLYRKETANTEKEKDI